MFLLLLGAVSMQQVQAAPPQKAQETGFLKKTLDEHPELTCGGIASLASGSVYSAGLSKGLALVAYSGFNPFVAFGSAVVVTFGTTATWFWAYDECIRIRNKNLDV
ncbi:MAG: hypothetical protein ACPGC9_00440 [Cytophagales bacterium]